MDDYVIEALDASKHERTEFSSGKAPLDEFLRTLVSQYEKRKLGTTFVAVRSGQGRVLGYYTLAAGAIAFAKLPKPAAKKLPKHPVPPIRLVPPAVDRSAQG